MIIKTSDANFATNIRNKHSLEIFGKSATLVNLASQRHKQPEPPRKSPQLSVVICGVNTTWTDEEIAEELRQQEYELTKIMRIKCKDGPTYLVRVLTTSQDTVSDLLTLGAFIYKKRHGVEPSRTQATIPIRCEKSQSYSSHNTS